MHKARPTANRPGETSTQGRVGGFSLIELVVVIIVLGILAAVAVPRFVAMSREARVAALKTVEGVMETAANQVHAMCALTPSCDYANANQNVVIGTTAAALNYGWPNAGDTLGYDDIDVWMTVDGFTPSIPNALQTRYSIGDAPDPAHCNVTYEEATNHASREPTFTLLTSGC